MTAKELSKKQGLWPKNGQFGGSHDFPIHCMTAGHADLFSVVLVVDLIKSKVLPLKLWSILT